MTHWPGSGQPAASGGTLLYPQVPNNKVRWAWRWHPRPVGKGTGPARDPWPWPSGFDPPVSSPSLLFPPSPFHALVLRPHPQLHPPLSSAHHPPPTTPRPHHRRPVARGLSCPFCEALLPSILSPRFCLPLTTCLGAASVDLLHASHPSAHSAQLRSHRPFRTLPPPPPPSEPQDRVHHNQTRSATILSSYPSSTAPASPLSHRYAATLSSSPTSRGRPTSRQTPPQARVDILLKNKRTRDLLGSRHGTPNTIRTGPATILPTPRPIADRAWKHFHPRAGHSLSGSLHRPGILETIVSVTPTVAPPDSCSLEATLSPSSFLSSRRYGLEGP